MRARAASGSRSAAATPPSSAARMTRCSAPWGNGSAHIAFAGGNSTLWDNGATTSGHDTVTGFNPAAGDRVSLSSATDTVTAVLASATSDLAGNVVVHLHDNSSITLVGVTPLMLTSGFFTTH